MGLGSIILHHNHHKGEAVGPGAAWGGGHQRDPCKGTCGRSNPLSHSMSALCTHTSVQMHSLVWIMDVPILYWGVGGGETAEREGSDGEVGTRRGRG